VYYKHFDVDIMTYLDLTEVLQMQFGLFAISFGVILFWSLGILFFSATSPSYEQMIEWRIEFQATHSPEQIKAIQEKNKKQSKKSKIILWLIFLWLILGVMIAPLAATVIFAYTEQVGIVLLGISILFLAWLIDFIYFFYLDISTEDKRYFNPEPRFAIARQAGLFLFLTYSSIAIAHITAVMYKGTSSVNEVAIVMEKETITTNKDLRFIGKTKNFTFFYNLSKKQALIYPNGSIKSASISEGIDYVKDDKKIEDGYELMYNKIKILFSGFKKIESVR
jgi:predicted nucleic acid-binding Zn ribbon protein